MKSLFRLTAVALLTCAALLAAGQQSYASKRQSIRAGIVILDSAKPKSSPPPLYGRSAAPFALFNLDRATQIKPAGWNIYNPHAPGTVTANMVSRWTEIEGLLGNDLPKVGAPISKANAEYWAVYLSQVTEQSMADYDLLIVNPAYYAELNPLEREKLNNFVDRGGVLWIDTGGIRTGSNGTDETNNYPLAFVPKDAGNGYAYSDTTSPLMTYPRTISGADLNMLHQANDYGMFQINLSDEGAIALEPFFYPMEAQFLRFQTVAAVGGSPTIAIGRIGGGEIVVTTRGATMTLNRVSTGQLFNPNSVAFQPAANDSYSALAPVLEDDGLAAAKLGINIISLASDYRQPGGNARNQNSSAIDPGAPVLKKFVAEGQNVALPIQTQPVIYKGIVAVSTGDHLTIYNANPGKDLDQKGDPDAGIGAPGPGIDNTLRDYSVGQPVDKIWISESLPKPLSAPVCAEVPGAASPDQVMVVDGKGTLHVYDLFARNASGFLIGGTHTARYAVSPPGPVTLSVYEGVPNSPTVSEGFAFIADATSLSPSPSGRVWIVDLSTGATLKTGALDWRAGGDAAVTLPAFTAPATVGYIPIQDNSGGYDRVVYGPGISGATDNPAVASIWLGVKGEKPTSVDVQPGIVTITTRAGSSGQGPAGGLPIYFPPAGSGNSSLGNLGVKVTLLDSSGNPLSAATMLTLVTGIQAGGAPGTIELILKNGITPAIWNGTVAGVRVDYTIDWSAAPDGVARGTLMFPLPQSMLNPPVRRVLGTAALSAQGTLSLIVSDPNPAISGVNGSLYMLREDHGRGQFRVVSRFELFPRHNFPLNQAVPSLYPPVFSDVDPVDSFDPTPTKLLSQEMAGFRWTGAPVVLGNQVYATATALKGGVVPVTVLMAFKADPETPTLHLTNLPQVTSLSQPDFERSDISPASSLPLNPDVVSILSPGDFTYDATTGVLTIPNLAGNTYSGNLSNCLSTSLPVAIRADGIPDRLTEPDAAGDHWSPLLWYSVFNGLSTQSSPVVAGGTIFFAGKSIVPALLSTGNLGPPSGVVNAVDSSIASNDNFLIHPGTRSWQSQLVSMQITATGINPDPHFRMPSSFGAQNFGDYVTRLLQTTMGTSSTAFGVVAGETSVVSYGDQGLYGFGRATFAVCDNGRVLEVDSSGNPEYVSNGNLNTGPGGGGFVGNENPLVRPTRAYLLSENDMLVVDTGGNRVVRLDTAGFETRSLSGFFTDPAFKPAGYQANEPLTFNGPRDALTYANYVTLPGSGPIVSNEQATEYWVHYLVADAGNHRLVELIDRYSVDNSGRIGPVITVNMPDPNAPAPPVNGVIPTKAIPQTGVLFWQSPATVSTKDFAYNSVSRVFLGSTAGGRYVYIAGIGNTQPSRIDTGLDNPALPNQPRQSSTGNGGVVVFDPQTPTGVRVYNSFDAPDLRATNFFDPVLGKFDNTTPASSPPQPSRPLTSVAAVTARAVLDPLTFADRLSVMVSDATGVYEFLIDPTAPDTSSSLGTPNWMINNAAFTATRLLATGVPAPTNAAQFVPGYARRLDTGEVLLVNSYTGITLAGTPYKGEVLLLGGNNFNITTNNLGFNTVSIHFALPPVTGVRGLVGPVFADRR